MIRKIKKNEISSTKMEVQNKDFEKETLVLENNRWFIIINGNKTIVKDVYSVDGVSNGLYVEFSNDPVLRQRIILKGE